MEVKEKSAQCAACNMAKAGVKSRRQLQHTCGKNASELMFDAAHNLSDYIKSQSEKS